MLECLAAYSVEKMPYAILPKYSPSGHKKVFRIIFHRLNLVFGPVKLMSCAFCVLRWWRRWCGTSLISKTRSPCGSSFWPSWLVYCFWLCSSTSYTRWEFIYSILQKWSTVPVSIFFNFTKISGRNIWLLTPLYIHLILFCYFLLVDLDWKYII